MILPLHEVVVSLDLLFVDHGNPEVGPEEELRAVESAGRHANDRERMLIEIDSYANDARIGIEVRPPEGVAQHDVWSGVGTLLVARVKEAAERGLHAKQIEVVS